MVRSALTRFNNGYCYWRLCDPVLQDCAGNGQHNQQQLQQQLQQRRATGQLERLQWRLNAATKAGGGRLAGVVVVVVVVASNEQAAMMKKNSMTKRKKKNEMNKRKRNLQEGEKRTIWAEQLELPSWLTLARLLTYTSDSPHLTLTLTLTLTSKQVGS
ncbi:hypothetical protein GQ42DRAFT_161461 [Ramicandelaber brevisporus]|nr:hypothetical protein GQ42DRAFT_161461 [Ramicandelaber brevisporus]